jgi:hypothetical protein
MHGTSRGPISACGLYAPNHSQPRRAKQVWLGFGAGTRGAPAAGNRVSCSCGTPRSRGKPTVLPSPPSPGTRPVGPPPAIAPRRSWLRVGAQPGVRGALSPLEAPPRRDPAGRRYRGRFFQSPGLGPHPKPRPKRGNPTSPFLYFYPAPAPSPVWASGGGMELNCFCYTLTGTRPSPCPLWCPRRGDDSPPPPRPPRHESQTSPEGLRK